MQYLGIDIGGTKCAVVVGDESGTIRARRQLPYPTSSVPWQVVLADLAAVSKEIAHGVRIDSVGISCGGPIDRKEGLILSPPNLPGWDDVPVKEFFERELNLPIKIENDANATAMAEWQFGAGRGTSNFVYLTMGTGIGGGLILDGRLYRGTNDLAGELGHQVILPDGPLCGCGKRGCLEALASGPAIANLAREYSAYGRESVLLELSGGLLEAITAVHVVIAAKQGDEFSINVLERVGYWMGIGLANVIQLLNPERIALGTIAVHAGDLILNPIKSALQEFAWERSLSVCDIVPAELGDRAQDLAALVTAMK